MHSIVLLTAMTATSGLFGGHKQARTAGCKGGSCARPVAVAHTPAVSNCSTGQCPTPYSGGHAAPAPAPQYRPTAYTSYYAAPASSCATGNCPKR